MTYLIKFNENGKRETTYPMDVTLSKYKVEKLKSQGFIEVSEEDFEYYCGAHGFGKNNTGYIRGADGKPTDAPPMENELKVTL